jgi:Fe-S cluster assembly protein SufB
LREHEDIFKEYFGSVIPVGDNKFAALNTAVWSGGSFVYVPKNVKVDIPLQAYFRINTENMGQFERTLMIIDEGAYVHYVEGCTAPIYSSDSLHSAVVEIVVRKGARCRYTTIQNWSTNVYNLVTKRAVAHEGATMEWVDGNLGSKVTMKYPAVWLTGEHAKGETLSIAFAGEKQHQDAGAKMVHVAPNTSSNIVSKSVARGGGRTSYRGLVQILEGAHGSKSTVKCDALLVDDISRSDTYPYVDVREDDVSMGHEATVSKISSDQLFYLMSRGMTEDEAMAMIVRGFIEPIARELPMEYAIELNRLIEMQMEGAVG